MTKLCKWGNSYAVRIPQELIHQLFLSEGDELSLDLIGDHLQLSKVSTARSKLKLMMQQFEGGSEVDPIVSSVGQEEW